MNRVVWRSRRARVRAAARVATSGLTPPITIVRRRSRLPSSFFRRSPHGDASAASILTLALFFRIGLSKTSPFGATLSRFCFRKGIRWAGRGLGNLAFDILGLPYPRYNRRSMVSSIPSMPDRSSFESSLSKVSGGYIHPGSVAACGRGYAMPPRCAGSARFRPRW